jgi:hypothetical protein
MYPDEQTLSAYLDDELPERERTEVEAALSDDDELRSRLHQLRELREALEYGAAEDGELQAWPDQAHERVWRRIQARAYLSESGRGFSRSVRVPLGTVVASAACFVALGAALVATAVQGQQSPSSVESLAASRETPITINVDSRDTDRLLEWLSSSEMLGQVNVQLPDTPQFEIIGEPVLLSASEYRKRSGARSADERAGGEAAPEKGQDAADRSDAGQADAGQPNAGQSDAGAGEPANSNRDER